MQEHQRLDYQFHWAPKYGSKENRQPLFWITNGKGGLFFVNNTDETLELVTTDTGGFQTCDDEVMNVSSNGYTYESVKPNEAVKIEEFDDYFDCDFLFQLYITVRSKKYGNVEFKTKPEKGGISDDVLLWNTGETGRYVGMKKLPA